MKVSVIVCTRNRVHAIIGCLESIAVALCHASPLEAEIIVVDNGSSDDSSAVVQKWAASCAFPVRLLIEPKTGVSAARNCALRAAQGALLVFTDDDCRLSETYVTELLRYDAGDVGLVLRGGRVELGDPTDLSLTTNTYPTLRRWQRQTPSADKQDLLGGKSVIGCNMTMRRAVAERVGFFDKRFGGGAPIPAAEDVDYVLRAYLAGVTIEYVPDMTIFHFHGRKANAAGQKLMRGYLIGAGALYVKYIFRDSSLCHELYWDVKKAVKEMVSGRNDFLRDMDFSYRDKVRCTVLGALKYLVVVVTRRK